MFFSIKNLFIIIVILAIVGLLSAAAYQIFYKQEKAFAESGTEVKILGTETLDVGGEADIEITYKNDNRTNLKNAVLTLNYPAEGFSDIKDKSGFGKIKGSQIIWDLGEISAGYEGSVKISAKITDVNANTIYASLDYDPENFNSSFSAKSNYRFNVKIAKVSVNLFAPKEAVAGQEIKYILTYTNATAMDFEMIRIKLNYPSGFVFSSAVPPAAQAPDIWEAPWFTRASNGRIEIIGVLNSSDEEAKIIGAVIEQRNRDGKYIFNNEISANTNLIRSPFVVVQMVNDKENYAADIGETLNYKIKIRNLSNAKQDNLILSAVLSGEAVDFTTLTAENANVDRALQTIIWDSKVKSDLIAVDPSKEIEVEFSVKTNKNIFITDSNSKNFLVQNIIFLKDGNVFNADGANKAIITASFETKINSDPILFVRGYFNDDERLKTSGVIPPKVGQVTAYNIHWQILNTSNKIKNTKVAGVLPSNIKWTGNAFPFDAKVFYDINTRTITWEAGDIEVGAGIISPLKEVLFQVSVEPETSDVGNYLVLIDKNSLSATDEFTLSEITVNAEGITTRLPDDLSIGPEEGKVSL
ncbi:MAG: hypothetical protein V1732_04050 [Patescibacteria group bacterium]